MHRKKRDDRFNEKDIAASLNNAVLRALKPIRIEIDDAKLRRLRRYAMAVIHPTLEHVDAGLLEPEELVGVLVTAALYVQLDQVMQTDKVPMAGKTKELFAGAKEDMEKVDSILGDSCKQ